MTITMSSRTPGEHLSFHKLWLDEIRSRTFERHAFEDSSLPFNDALRYHWLRSCWVILYWSLADQNQSVLPPVNKFGWKINDGQIKPIWD